MTKSEEEPVAKKWFYAKKDMRFGPVTTAALKKLRGAGDLAPTDLVWRKGLDDWLPVRDVDELAVEMSNRDYALSDEQASSSEPPPLGPREAGITSGNARMTKDDRERVGFGPRLGALLIDVIAIGVLVLLLAMVFVPGAWSEQDAMRRQGFAAVLASFYWLWEAKNGTALGKIAVGLVIGSTDGTPAPSQVLVRRWALKAGILQAVNFLGVMFPGPVLALANVICLVALGVSYLFMLGEHKQSLHDRICGTAVFWKSRVPTPQNGGTHGTDSP